MRTHSTNVCICALKHKYGGICGGTDSSFEVEIIQVFINSIRVFLGKNNNTNAVINQEKNLNTEKWFYFFLFHSKA